MRLLFLCTMVLVALSVQAEQESEVSLQRGAREAEAHPNSLMKKLKKVKNQKKKGRKNKKNQGNKKKTKKGNKNRKNQGNKSQKTKGNKRRNRGRKQPPQGRAAIKGNNCEYIFLADITSNSGCTTGNKFVIKGATGVRKQFLILNSKTTLAFVTKGAKFTACTTFTDITTTVTCKEVTGLASVDLGSSGSAAATTEATAGATTAAAGATTLAPVDMTAGATTLAPVDMTATFGATTAAAGATTAAAGATTAADGDTTTTGLPSPPPLPSPSSCSSSTREGDSPIFMGLVTGGSFGPSQGATSAVEILGGDCTVADLPSPRLYHVTFLTPDNRTLVCGGSSRRQDDGTFSEDSCLEYSLELETWRPHSRLIESRQQAGVASLPGGVYILGGRGRGGTEILARGAVEWTEGPRLPGGVEVRGPCAVPVSSTSLLLIGGQSGRLGGQDLTQVQEYSQDSGAWTQWPDLIGARRDHACHRVGSLVVVAGGSVAAVPGPEPGAAGGSYETLSTVELIDLKTRQVRAAGSMNSPRHAFAMFQIGFPGSRILLTFGSAGDDSVSNPASLLQEWQEASESWIPSPAVLTSRQWFSAATVPANLVCKPASTSTPLEGSLQGFCEDFDSSHPGTVDYCKPAEDRQAPSSCFKMPCYALNHCPRYIRLQEQLNSFPCCCAHPCTRRRFKDKCDSFFGDV